MCATCVIDVVCSMCEIGAVDVCTYVIGIVAIDVLNIFLKAFPSVCATYVVDVLAETCSCITTPEPSRFCCHGITCDVPTST